MLWFAGAALAQHVFDEMKELAIETCGERILFLTGLGSTETAPFALGAHVGERATPPTWACRRRACELKLVPIEGKLEARLRGPEHHAGLLAPAGADREGLRRGRLLPARRRAASSTTRPIPAKGLLFDGRIAEDFKLATGTWVSVGPLRARLIDAFRALCRATS